MAKLVQGHDWSATPLGAIETWSPVLRATVELVLHHGFPSIVLWGAELTQIYNDGYAAVMGRKHPAGLGQPTRQCWPEVWHINEPIYDRVRAGETLTFEDALYPLERNGPLEDVWFTLTYCPIHENAGVAGVLVTLFETTEAHLAASRRAAAEAELRRSEQRFRAFVTASADVVYRMSPDWTELHELDGRGFLADTTAPSADWRARYILPEDRAMLDAAIASAIAQQANFQLEHRVRKADGTIGWTHSRAVPIRDASGGTLEWLGTASDITARKQADIQLREGAERLRSAVEVGRLGLWDWDVKSGAVHWSDEQFRMEGFAPGEVTPSYALWADRLHPDDRTASEAALRDAMEAEHEYVREFRVVHPNGAIRWLSARGRFFYDDAGTPVRMIGAMSDVTERRESEERQAILLAELQHRVRNILAVVRSIASRSEDGERTAEDYVQHLQGRIAALARTQVLLTRSAGAGADLQDLIRDELLAQAASERQFTLDGPDVRLSPKATEVLTLALHELATNATKYGAFARDRGRLEVRWCVEPRLGEPWIVLSWVERNVAIVQDGPRRHGFGMELVTRRIPYELKGDASVELQPGGVRCELEFPLRPGESILETNYAT